MKSKWITDSIIGALLIFYVHSSISNFVQLQSLKNMLAFYTLHFDAYALIILIIEIALSVLLFVPSTRKWGLGTSAIFIAILLLTINRSPHFPNDFGGLINYLTYTQKLLATAILFILSAIGFILSFVQRRKAQKSKEIHQVIYT